MELETRRAVAIQFAYQMLRDAAQADTVKPEAVLGLAERIDRFLRDEGVPSTTGRADV